jgi:hypothetical protein
VTFPVFQMYSLIATQVKDEETMQELMMLLTEVLCFEPGEAGGEVGHHLDQLALAIIGAPLVAIIGGDCYPSGAADVHRVVLRLKGMLNEGSVSGAPQHQ